MPWIGGGGGGGGFRVVLDLGRGYVWGGKGVGSGRGPGGERGTTWGWTDP